MDQHMGGKVTQARWKTGRGHEYFSIFKDEYSSLVTYSQPLELGRKRSGREKVGH